MFIFLLLQKNEPKKGDFSQMNSSQSTLLHYLSEKTTIKKRRSASLHYLSFFCLLFMGKSVSMQGID